MPAPTAVAGAAAGAEGLGTTAASHRTGQPEGRAAVASFPAWDTAKDRVRSFRTIRLVLQPACVLLHPMPRAASPS